MRKWLKPVANTAEPPSTSYALSPRGSSGAQAAMWDESFIPTVAVMLTYFGKILDGSATSTHQMEFRHLAGALGLTAEGMKRLGWAFEGDAQ